MSKGRNRKGTAGRVLVWMLRSALFVPLIAGAAGFGQAQEQSNSALNEIAHAKPAATYSAPTAPQAERRAAGGPHEGIKVHGHWVIEVKNRDGSLAARREFENSLITTSLNNGGQMLAALLGRVISSGIWMIDLSPSPAETGVIAITEPKGNGVVACNGLQKQFSSTGSPFSCSTNLSLTAPAIYKGEINQAGLTGPSTLTLSGTGVVPEPSQSSFTQIGYVATAMIVCAATDTPAACTTDSNDYSIYFTSRNLDGLNGDPPPISVIAGQTVNVMVTFSFQ